MPESSLDGWDLLSRGLSDALGTGAGMRGAPESSLDGWDLLTRGLSDASSHSQQAGDTN